MTVLFDTDVLIDFLLDRKPFSDPAARLLSAADRGELRAMTCATSITTVYYLARKALGSAKARRQVQALLALLDVAPVNRAVLDAALLSPLGDFEDAVVAHAARQAAADVIVTRNQKDFRLAPLPAQTPAEVLALLAAQGDA
jgi:predicted nucleic acid-binding protein